MSEQVQVAIGIITKLKSDSNVNTLLATFDSVPAVFTHTPQDFSGYPYIVVKDILLNGNDNDADLGFEGVINIHTWSDKRDLLFVGNLQKAIYDALHHFDMPMAGYDTVEMHQEYSNILLDPDGITMHGIQRYRIILQTT